MCLNDISCVVTDINKAVHLKDKQKSLLLQLLKYTSFNFIHLILCSV